MNRDSEAVKRLFDPERDPSEWVRDDDWHKNQTAGSTSSTYGTPSRIGVGGSKTLFTSGGPDGNQGKAPRPPRSRRRWSSTRSRARSSAGSEATSSSRSARTLETPSNAPAASGPWRRRGGLAGGGAEARGGSVCELGQPNSMAPPVLLDPGVFAAPTHETCLHLGHGSGSEMAVSVVAANEARSTHQHRWARARRSSGISSSLGPSCPASPPQRSRLTLAAEAATLLPVIRTSERGQITRRDWSPGELMDAVRDYRQPPRRRPRRRNGAYQPGVLVDGIASLDDDRRHVGTVVGIT